VGMPYVMGPQCLLPARVHGWSAYLYDEVSIRSWPLIPLLFVYYIIARVVLGPVEAACHEDIVTANAGRHMGVVAC